MVEPLINHWTVDHFLFGLGISIIISFLIKRKYSTSLITLFILVLWELFEYREKSSYWIINYQNNIMDVIVGFVAAIIGFKFYEFVAKYFVKKEKFTP
jgi:hypothetical protein